MLQCCAPLRTTCAPLAHQLRTTPVFALSLFGCAFGVHSMFSLWFENRFGFFVFLAFVVFVFRAFVVLSVCLLG